jgi:hypothetical protein
MTTASVLADPRVRLGAGTAALGLVIDAALTLVNEKLEPKGPCYRDLGP